MEINCKDTGVGLKITVLGAGAMGSLFSGYLSRKNDVTVVDVSETVVNAIKAAGVRIKEKDGNVACLRLTAVTDASSCGKQDLIIVFVKSIFTIQALENNRSLIGKDTYILKDYADDFSKHAPGEEVIKMRWIWDSIPVQLARENRKFMFSHVREGKRAAYLEDALQWLVDAGLVVKLHLVENPELPLSGFANKSYFKVYLCDVGLLRVKSKVDAGTVFDETPSYIRFKGAFTENYVLNELVSYGKEPYFWHSGNTAEVDFIYENKGEIVPVEVKSAENTQAKSYTLFCQKYRPGTGFKLSQKNIAENNLDGTKTYSIPLYLCWNLDGYRS